MCIMGCSVHWTVITSALADITMHMGAYHERTEGIPLYWRVIMSAFEVSSVN